MTFSDIETEFLSFRIYVRRVILPAAILIFVALIILKLISQSEVALQHQALIIGFFGLYFVLVRGGHILMIRSLHRDLKAKFKAPYQERLDRLDLATLRKRNLGFVLARMKRDILVEMAEKRSRLTHPDRYKP